MLVSGIEGSDSDMCVYVYVFFYTVGYYKILNIVLCATQEDLVVYLFCTVCSCWASLVAQW